MKGNPHSRNQKVICIKIHYCLCARSNVNKVMRSLKFSKYKAKEMKEKPFIILFTNLTKKIYSKRRENIFQLTKSMFLVISDLNYDATSWFCQRQKFETLPIIKPAAAPQKRVQSHIVKNTINNI